ncbi:metalloprotease [Coprinopsis marcescibilis]|uniref:Metalloprotease n=1 Tax=Coprinopsis marcescibilis TaxID=230819 RepID=A0A5C3KR90_COPMA|nr:metalloprotease [Coprinopsis marcescibilis]
MLVPATSLLSILSIASSVVAAPSFSFSKWHPTGLTPSGPSEGDNGAVKRSVVCAVSNSMEKRRSRVKKLKTMRKPERNNKNSEVTIPVQFFVIASNETLEGGWVPDSQIMDQIDVLNEDFANAMIKWDLVNTTRIINEEWFEGVSADNDVDKAMKTELRVGKQDTLNIYTVELTRRFFGYATFPDDYDEDPKADGVVLNYRTLPKGSLAPFNEGRTLTHEVGHWVGLFHTFVEEDDRDEDGCNGDGDFVDDTPPQLEPTDGCTVQDTCIDQAGEDNRANFMDYSDDSCMQLFTPGQVERMREELAVYRDIDA